MSVLSGCVLETITKELNPKGMRWKCLPDPSPWSGWDLSGSRQLRQGSVLSSLCPQQHKGRKAARRCRHHQDASGQEAVSREKGRRKEEEAFGAFVNCSSPSRWEGTEVTCGPRPRAMVHGSRAGPAASARLQPR